jgi:hypothetical protein
VKATGKRITSGVPQLGHRGLLLMAGRSVACGPGRSGCGGGFGILHLALGAAR